MFLFKIIIACFVLFIAWSAFGVAGLFYGLLFLVGIGLIGLVENGVSEDTGNQSGPGYPRTHSELSRAVSQLVDRRDVLLIDVETTGLNENAVVVEACVIDTIGPERFHSYFKVPKGVRFQAKAAEVNKLSRERLKELGACSFADKWPDLNAVLEDAVMVLAWNADFDKRLLDQTLVKHELTRSRVRFEDLIPVFRQHMGEGNYSLSAIAGRFGVAELDEHTARGDVQTLLSVLKAAAEAKPDKGPVMSALFSSEPSITVRQDQFITDLCDQLDIDRSKAERYVLDGERARDVSSASKVIDRLLAWRDSVSEGRVPRALRKLV